MIARWGQGLGKLGRAANDRKPGAGTGQAGPFDPAPAEPIRPPRAKGPGVRLLPALIFVAVLMLGVRVGDVWTALNDPATLLTGPGSPTQAQTAQDSGRAVPPPSPEAEMAESTPAENTMAGATNGSATQIAEAPTVAADPALLEELGERRQALEARERALDEREALLTVAERRLDEKLAEMAGLRDELEAMMAGLDEAAEERLNSLVRVYEAMRPGDAATIFDSLDLEVLIGVLQRMRENRAAPILANMNPARAREVTAELAARRLEQPIE